jgi:hypothetical protein
MSFDVPILFICFNRPTTTKKVFDVIRTIRPNSLYISIDGPREENRGEILAVNEVEKIFTNIDWPCNLKILKQDKNLGGKEGPLAAIDWLFENEAFGIILEDDCLPNRDFFYFCKVMLHKYKENERIYTITGDNFQDGVERGRNYYYFSKFNHVWGWATWRRAWQFNDPKIKFWPKWSQSLEWVNFTPDMVERKYWNNIFDRVYAGDIDTWDYPWMASVWERGGLTVTPNTNLVSNIGFSKDATRTRSSGSKYANMKVGSIELQECSPLVVRDIDADKYVFNNLFKGSWLRFPLNVFQPLRELIAVLRKYV